MGESVREFYDGLAGEYHLMFADWRQEIARQGEALDALIRNRSEGVTASLLDCACGIGTQAIALALKGYRVHATDFSAPAVERARREAQSFGAAITFGIADFRALDRTLTEHFDVVIPLSRRGRSPAGPRADARAPAAGWIVPGEHPRLRPTARGRREGRCGGPGASGIARQAAGTGPTRHHAVGIRRCPRPPHRVSGVGLGIRRTFLCRASVLHLPVRRRASHFPSRVAVPGVAPGRAGRSVGECRVP
jgi:SAM-dependent methyltransferase